MAKIFAPSRDRLTGDLFGDAPPARRAAAPKGGRTRKRQRHQITEAEGKAVLELSSVLRALRVQSDAAARAIRADVGYPAWTGEVESDGEVVGLVGVDGRELAAEAVAAIEYVEPQDSRETRRFCGLVAASLETLVAIENLNRVKEAAADLLTSLRRTRHARHMAVHLESHEPHAVDQVLLSKLAGDTDYLTAVRDRREDLNRVGAGRLHLVQATRRVPVLSHAPIRVAFSWNNQSRVIREVSVKDAIAAVERRRKNPKLVAYVESDLSLLRTLSGSLYYVEAIKPLLRANVLSSVTGKFQTRGGPLASLPLFYHAECGAELPDIKPPRAQDYGIQKRRRRCDRVISGVSITKSVRLYTARSETASEDEVPPPQDDRHHLLQPRVASARSDT